jgi:hypothetical protein
LTSPGWEEQHLVAPGRNQAADPARDFRRLLYEARQEIVAETLKGELFEGRMALSDDLLVFLDRNGDLGVR